MALTRDPSIPAIDPDEEVARQSMGPYPPPDARCAYCFNPVCHPAVYWHSGTVGVLYLHISCAMRWSSHLTKDAADGLDLLLVGQRAGRLEFRRVLDRPD